ncbi:MAG: CPBP family intramembrane metalloprotease, partial [Acidobacteria bacterium]|nr:CPBP family intramembrane metalloprotease [Acidobacteriota bacterium]
SPLSRPAQAGPGEFLHPFARACLYLAIGYLGLPWAVSTLLRDLPEGARYALLYFLLNAGLLVEGWLFLHVFDRRTFRTLGLWFYPGAGRELVCGAVGGALLMALVVVLLYLSQALHYSGLAGASGRLLPRLAASAGVFLLAAAFEEIAFRGYAFQRLLDEAGPIVAVAAISGLFGGLHLTNPYATPLSTANTVLAGVLFSLAYLKTRALWLPIGLHWAWNFFQGTIFSLPVSGLRLGSTLLRAELTGADWLTGGFYGPEGGLAVTLVSLAGITWLALTRRLGPSPAMQEVLK